MPNHRGGFRFDASELLGPRPRNCGDPSAAPSPGAFFNRARNNGACAAWRPHECGGAQTAPKIAKNRPARANEEQRAPKTHQPPREL